MLRRKFIAAQIEQAVYFIHTNVSNIFSEGKSVRDGLTIA